ncbi:MAG: hypothetical protein QM438_10205 [Euryarchaeota archaeon]|nr:hypothetical protein [Euryarchaeota archaeon]
MIEKELVFKRKICRTANGQARICLPRPIAEAFAKCGHIGLIWRAGSLVIAPWPEEDAA